MTPLIREGLKIKARLLNQALKINKNFWRHKESVSIAEVASREEALSYWLPHIPDQIQVSTLDFGEFKVDRLIPPDCIEQRAILYLHGGGYIAGSPASTHRDYIWRIATATQSEVWAVNYRKLPEFPFPAALDDAYRSYEALLKRFDATRLAVAGDSAGGGLALALVLRLKGEGKPLPAAVSVASPWTDLTCSGASIGENSDTEVMVPEHLLNHIAELYAGGQPLDHPYVSPLFGDFAGFPPTQVLVSEDEVLRDDSLRLAQRLTDAGIPVELIREPGMPHVWPVFARLLPESREALARIGAFLSGYLEGGG